MTHCCRSYRRRPGFDIDGGDEVHYPTRPVDKDKAEQELVINIKKATSPDETAPKQKHVRSTFTTRLATIFQAHFVTECIVYTWDYHSSISFWSGLRVQPILSDEIQTFKALITVHKVLQEGHPNVRDDLTYTDVHRCSFTKKYRLSRRHMDRRDGLRLALVPLLQMASEVGSVARDTPNSS